MKKISEQIKREHRDIHETKNFDDSHFHLTFHDDSEIKEHDANWSSMSEHRTVEYRDGKKAVMLLTQRAKHIKIIHDGQSLDLDVPDGHDVYQFTRAETFLVPHKEKQTRIIGRGLGFIKNNKIVEEYFLNGLEGITQGFRF